MEAALFAAARNIIERQHGEINELRLALSEAYQTGLVDAHFGNPTVRMVTQDGAVINTIKSEARSQEKGNDESKETDFSDLI